MQNQYVDKGLGGNVQFPDHMLEGTLIRRHRYHADVKLVSGEQLSVHCANAGSLIGCSSPGSKVLVSSLDSPRRRYQHQLEIIYAGRTPVSIHAGRPMTVVIEALQQGLINELAGYATLRRPDQPSTSGRWGCVLEGNSLRPCHLHVEAVTAARDGRSLYPDGRYSAGHAYLQELIDLVREGHRAMIILVAPRSDVESIHLSDNLDHEYAQHFRDATARGVEHLAFRAKISKKTMQLAERLPFNMEPDA